MKPSSRDAGEQADFFVKALGGETAMLRIFAVMPQAVGHKDTCA